MAAASDKDGTIDEIRSYLTAQKEDRPSDALGRTLSPKGQATLRQILIAGHQVFFRDGHAGLSMRKVAEEAGLAVGNISYYFPSKRALIDATLKEARADFIEHHIRLFDGDEKSPLAILLNILDFYILNGRSSHSLYFQIWGFAGSDESAKIMVRELYRPIGRLVYYLVRAARPDIGHLETRAIVLQLFSLEEGMKLFIGMGSDDDDALTTAEDHIRTLAKRIIAG